MLDRQIELPTPHVRVYVAGPLYGSGVVSHNVFRAICAAEEIYAAGMVPFVPHLYHLWDMTCPQSTDYWLQLDKAWLPTCHAMLRLHGDSPGASKEESWCYEYGIPVYHCSTGIGTQRLINDFKKGTLNADEKQGQGAGQMLRGEMPEANSSDCGQLKLFQQKRR